ncbi:MAG: hypothetical protein AAGI37_11665 [Planctomycetota bacterium]
MLNQTEDKMVGMMVASATNADESVVMFHMTAEEMATRLADPNMSTEYIGHGLIVSTNKKQQLVGMKLVSQVEPSCEISDLPDLDESNIARIQMVCERLEAVSKAIRSRLDSFGSKKAA